MVKLFRTLIFLTFIGCIFSQAGLPSFDFGSLPSANSPPSPCVTPSSITSSKSCTSQSTTFSYCCQMTPTSGTGQFCSSVGPTQYLPSMKTWAINGTSYNVQCDIVDGLTGTPCGVLSPKTYTDCTRYSNTTNSCCMYSNSTLNVNYCFWIGMPLSISPVPSVQCNPPSTGMMSSDASIISYYNLLIMSIIVIIFFF